MDKVKMIEDMGYDNLVVSIKSSDVLMCAKAHELLAPKCPYPLHGELPKQVHYSVEISNLQLVLVLF